MKKSAQILIMAALIAFFLFINLDAEAQCAMCKATAESSLKEDSGQAGNGINKGILYIMFVPYSLIMILVGIFFRKNLRQFFRQIGLLK